MPKGEPSKQSIATRKYEAKIGMISKTYKLKKELVDSFKASCDKAGESQSAVLSRFMQQYIDEHK